MAIALFDRDMRYLAASEGWVRDYGLSGELVGRSHYAVFPEIGEAWKAIHRRTLAGETISASEEGFLRADGRTEWINWETRPWRRAGDEIGGIIIYSADVTALVEARTALADSEARFKGLAEALRLGQAHASVAPSRPAPSLPNPTLVIPPDPVRHVSPERRRIVEQLRVANDILASLPDALFDGLADRLAPVSYEAGTTLIEPLQSIQTIYFPLEGLNAAILHLADGTSAEVAIGSRGGLAGVAALSGAAFEETETRALMRGSALAVSARFMREVMAAQPALRERVGWFLPMLMAQISLSVACNARHSLLQRLARWLLTASARVGSTDLVIGQETIANSLGVRRTGVTEAVAHLKDDGIVTTGRNRISIVNPQALEAHACECYREGMATRSRYTRAPDGPPALSAEAIQALLDEYRGLK